jgi:hypothetical protein
LTNVHKCLLGEKSQVHVSGYRQDGGLRLKGL